jgi:arginase
MRVGIIGVPMDLGADRRGVDMGASAIRYAGLGERLRELGHEVEDHGNIFVPQPETFPVGDHRLKYLEPIVHACDELAALVSRTLSSGSLPLILGGDHSIALGSVAGVAQALKDIGLIWFDAHGDFNTTETTPSGNIHGMILAALAGLGDQRLTQLAGFSPKVPARRIAIIGARDLDPGERVLLKQSGVRVFTMQDIDRHGMSTIVQEAISLTTGETPHLHVSFDMDVLDPREAHGVGTPVRGGITYREAHLAMEMVADSNNLRSLDVVEVNPILDEENRTASLAVELILSALGKKIL